MSCLFFSSNVDCLVANSTKYFYIPFSFSEHCSSTHYWFVDFIRPGETEKPMFLPARATNAA